MPGVVQVNLVFKGDTKQATAVVNALVRSLGKLNQAQRQASSAQGKGREQLRHFQQLGEHINRNLDALARFGHQMRYLSQGISEFGRTLTYSVSLPLFGAFAAGIRQAVNWEDALVRVGKTTGLYGDVLDLLGEKLQKIAGLSTSTHVELTAMAEQVGQLGVSNVASIANLVRWFDVFASATDVSADTVAKSMGRVANAFGWDLNTDKGVENIIRVMNVINQLENTLPASAAEITQAIYDFASVANLLEIPADSAAALGAVVISLGNSADATGRRLSTMFTRLVQNADVFAEIAASTERYADSASVIAAISEDPVRVLQDMLEILQTNDLAAQRLAAAFELTGQVGGRALGSLVQNAELLEEALQTARQEWLTSRSLIVEYERSLESAKAQMQILRNSVANAAISIGNGFLPAVNDLVKWAVPAIRLLTKEFLGLPKATQQNILLFAALAVVVPPLILLFGSLVHAASLVFLGLLGIPRAIIAVVLSLSRLLGAFGATTAGAQLFVASLVIWFLSLVKRVNDSINKMGGAILSQRARLRLWGEAIIQSFAEGIVRGIRWVYQAATMVANAIARLFEAHSPPEEGPLAHIDQWGKTLFDTYLQGFAEADFSVLSGVGRRIEQILKSFVAIGKLDEGALPGALASARTYLSQLIATFNETGQISESVLAKVIQDLGTAGEYVGDLIRKWLEYVRIQKELEALEQRRKALLQSYKDTVATIATDETMSAKEKAAALREAERQHDKELRALDEEKEALEAQKEEAGAQLDWQRELVDAMIDQDDIFGRIADTLEDIAGSLSGGLGEFGGLGSAASSLAGLGGEFGIPDFDLELEKIFQERMGVLQGFFDALSGKAPLSDIDAGGHEGAFDTVEQRTQYDNMYNAGLKVKETWETILGIIDNVSGTFNTLNSKADEHKGTLDGIVSAAKTLSTLYVGAKIFSFGKGVYKGGKAVGEFLFGKRPDVLSPKSKMWRSVTGFISRLTTKVGPKLKTGLGKVFTFLGGAVGKFGGALKWVIGLFGGAIAAVGTSLVAVVALGAAIAVLFMAIKVHGKRALETLRMLFVLGASFFAEKFAKPISEWAQRTWEKVQDGARRAWDTIGQKAGDAARRLSDAWNRALNWLRSLPDKVRLWIQKAIDRVQGFGSGVVNKLSTAWSGHILPWLQGKASEFGEKFAAIKTSAAEKIEDFGVVIQEKLASSFTNVDSFFRTAEEKFRSAGAGFVRAMRAGIARSMGTLESILNGIAQKVEDAINKIIKAINDFSGLNIPLVNINGISLGGGGSSVSGGGSAGGGAGAKANSPVFMATGGIVTKPIRAFVGEKAKEAIIPLDRLPDLVAHMMPEPSGDRDITVNINIYNPIVRDDRDIERLAREIERIFTQGALDKLRFSGTYG